MLNHKILKIWINKVKYKLNHHLIKTNFTNITMNAHNKIVVRVLIVNFYVKIKMVINRSCPLRSTMSPMGQLLLLLGCARVQNQMIQNDHHRRDLFSCLMLSGCF